MEMGLFLQELSYQRPWTVPSLELHGDLGQCQLGTEKDMVVVADVVDGDGGIGQRQGQVSQVRTGGIQIVTQGL